MDWAGAAVAAGRIAGAVAGGSSAPTRAAETLDELRSLIPYTGTTLGAWDPVRRRHLTVAGSGYLDETAEDLNSEVFLADKMGQVVLGRGLPTRWRDLPFAPETSRFWQDTLAPCGFREGMAAPLFAPDGSYVGLLNVNTDSAKHPDDAAVEMIRLLGARFAEVVAALVAEHRSAPVATEEFPEHRVVLSPAGDCTSLDADWSPSQELTDALRHHATGRFLVWEQGQQWPWHIDVDPAGSSALPVIARLSNRPVPGGLSRRELQVLGGVADGLTNQQVATELHSSPRTVSTHVEHILAKLEVRTRTEAATRAHRDGLYLRG